MAWYADAIRVASLAFPLFPMNDERDQLPRAVLPPVAPKPEPEPKQAVEDTRELRESVYNLYMEKGLPPWRIARELGISRTFANRILEEIAESMPVSSVATIRKFDLGRIDQIIASFWEQACAGDRHAAKVVLEYLEAKRAYVPNLAVVPGSSDGIDQLAAMFGTTRAEAEEWVNEKTGLNEFLDAASAKVGDRK